MGLSTRRRLAVNTMIDLALREQAGPVALSAIARRHRVSLSCVEQLFARLRKAGLVESTRGPGGGYRLGRDAAGISLAAIVGAVETSATRAGVDDARAGLTHDLSQRLDTLMHEHMVDITLADLVATHRDAGVVVEAEDVRPLRMAFAPLPQISPVAPGVPNSVFELGTLNRP